MSMIRYTPEAGTDHTHAGPAIFRGVNVTLLVDPGDEDDPGWPRKWLLRYLEESVRSKLDQEVRTTWDPAGVNAVLDAWAASNPSTYRGR
jgi:hypothetical protein